MMMKGKITRTFLPLGYAFIRDEVGTEYFFHATESLVPWDGVNIQEGKEMEFIPEPDGKHRNKLRATKVKLA